MVLVLLIFAAALFIDGATDCANSVTGAVSSKTLSVRSAALLSAVLSFAGCALFCVFLPTVAENSAAADFPSAYSQAGVLSSLISVALWSGLAWVLSLPTSEGHGLIAAAAGSAAALGGRVIYQKLWRVILWMVPSALVGALISVLFVKILKNAGEARLKAPIILSCALSSVFHGAQDGQKFLALAISSSLGGGEGKWKTALLFAFFMGVGTLFGERIIRKMGGEMAVADKRAALSCDIGSALSLCILTVVGIPASTTHIRMTSLVAATRASGGKTDPSAFLLLLCAWVSTFPVCFALGFFISKLILVILL